MPVTGRRARPAAGGGERTPSVALAKVARPRLFDVVPRARLFRKIDAARAHPAVWISGPPGAGKSTLAASYVETRGLSAVWIRLDAGDVDPGSFFYHLGLAAARARPRGRGAAAVLAPEHRGDVPGFARRYFRRLYAGLPAATVVVLDNVQDVLGAPAMAAIVAIAIEEIPEGANVVAISREDPPAPFALMRASGRIACIDWDALRFTPREAMAVVWPSRGERARGRRSFAPLVEAAGGWAAALVLLREHLRHRRRDAGPAAASRDAIFAYFAGHVFDGLPAEVRALLLATAHIPTLTADLVARLTGNADAGKHLDALCRRNLFVERRGGVETVYQYHALFREFLDARAVAELPPARRRRLVAETGALLRAEGKLEEAFGLFRSAGDWNAAAALLVDAAPALLRQGRGETLRQWMGELPAARREPDPWLLYWRGMSQLRVDENDARACLQSAWERFAARGDPRGQRLAACGMLEVIHAHGANYHDVGPWIDRVLRLSSAARSAAFATVDEELRASTGLLIAMLLGERSRAGLEAQIERAMALVGGDADVNRRLATAIVVLEYFGWERRFDMIEILAARVRPLLDDRRASPHACAKWHVWLGQILYNRVRYADALAEWRRAREIAVREGLPAIELEVAHYELLQHLSVADAKAAAAQLGIVLPLLGHARPMDLAFHHYETAWLRLLERDGAAARRHAAEALRLATLAGLPPSRLGTYLVMEAYAAIAGGAHDAALARLREAVRAALPLRTAQLRCLVDFAEAVGAGDEGDEPRAMRHLRAGFAAARELQYPMFFRPLPDVAARLCAAALRAGVEPEFVGTVVALRRLAPPSPELDAWPWPLRVRALGRFVVERDGEALEFAGKAQKRPLDLLKALIAAGGREVDATHLTAALWPDAVGDAARHAFDVTLARLRRLLGVDNAVVIRGGKLSLDNAVVWTDVWAFEAAARGIESATAQAQAGSKTAVDAAAAGEVVLRLYGGHFLEGEPPEAWAMPMRDRQRSRFLRLVLALGQACERAGEAGKAIALYRRGLELDSLAEELYRRLIACHAGLGDRAAAVSAYRRCRELLSVVLGVAPSPETDAAYRAACGGDSIIRARSV